MRIFNSLTRKKEEFEPRVRGRVGLYTCGMTVYDYAHIGHGRKYVNDDVLRRTLKYLGYKVEHVQNVTDVGHLVSDGDEGEDKLEKGARKQGKSVWEVAEFFTKHFYKSMEELNILRPDVVCKATEHIDEQIDLVKRLVEKGFAYETKEAVYFEVSKFEGYGEMFGQSLDEKLVAVRDEVRTGEHKRAPADFAVWFKTVGRFRDHVMRWDSPWGEGFPGWHIECSAMGMKYLGEQFDLHTGGEDHLSVHHPNEIAQAEGASGKKPFVKYWVHHAFLMVEGRKMSKSLGNYLTIEDVVKKGYDPLALRYLYLTAHYRKPQNFTWDALEGAAEALGKLRRQVYELRGPVENGVVENEFTSKFDEEIGDDLNMPRALSVVWGLMKSDLGEAEKYKTILWFDRVLGLGLKEVSPLRQACLPARQGYVGQAKVPEEVLELVEKREKLRKEKKFAEADRIREEMGRAGFVVEDSKDGSVVRKVS